MTNAPSASGPAISLQKLSRHFGAVKAVDGVSLEIAAGSLVALVGLSGSGKSTLLKMINRLVDPTAGTVLNNGQNILEDDPHVMRRRLGSVFQNKRRVPPMSIRPPKRIGRQLA